MADPPYALPELPTSVPPVQPNCQQLHLFLFTQGLCLTPDAYVLACVLG